MCFISESCQKKLKVKQVTHTLHETQIEYYHFFKLVSIHNIDI
jgi:hypothetical protein